MRPLRTAATCAGSLSLLVPLAAADGLDVELRGSYIESITSGGDTVHISELRSGESTGAVDFTDELGYAVTAADGRNLATYFARGTTTPEWHVDLSSWHNTNGSAHDFFVFDVGGNDSLVVAPRFPDGSYGQDRSVSGWSATGYVARTGPNSGQQIDGLAFRHSHMRDTNGQPLNGSVEIAGLRFRSDSIDGAAFLAIEDGSPNMADGDGSYLVRGFPRVGQPFEIVYEGPWARETDIDPNPFTDYRLNVTFTGPGGLTYVIPGFFDGNGQGGEAGKIWRVRFAPDAPGHWVATTSFRAGPDVAVSLSATPGVTGPILDGIQVPIDVQLLDPGAPGFYKHGRLRYVNEHYQQFDDGKFFIKTGTNSPENLLGFKGFDGPGRIENNSPGAFHSYAPHVDDWEEGDPLFNSRDYGTDSKGIIGAINFLSSVGVNSMHSILMNLGGDGNDVFPFLGAEDDSFSKTHYDTSRLRQWNEVFEHAARKGVGLHLTFGETESANETWLDDGNLGLERKLYYRELVARFAHNPVIKWTLTEENDFSASRLREFSDYVRALDAYDHPVTFHNFPNDFAEYAALLGEETLSASGFQYHRDQIGDQLETWRESSRLAGRPWLMHADEQTPWNAGATNGSSEEMRKRVLYDVLFSGGQIEWYAGWYDLPLGGDLSLENFRTRKWVYEDSTRCREFMEENLRFWQMEPDDSLLGGEDGLWGGGQVLTLPGVVYAIYLPCASPSGTLDLTATTGNLTQRWYNPREGRFEGTATPLMGGVLVPLGSPPSDPNEDWIALVSRPVRLSEDL